MQVTPRTRALVVLVAGVLVVVLAVVLSRHAAPGEQPSGQAGRTVAASGVSTSAGPTSRTSSAQGTDPASGLRWVAESSLNAQARQTVALVQRGGPYPYPRNDGVVYHNANGVLPHERDGYYHEYTVPTPGASSRGTRRIITGADGQFYYTADHYDSFARVRIGT